MFVALILAQLATTNCYPVAGNTTQCQTSVTPGVATAPVPNVGLEMMLQNQRDQQARQAAQQQVQVQASPGAAERRAAAYAQVGDLIAKGDCTGAKRLAAFYGHADIVRDTAKACP